MTYNQTSKEMVTLELLWLTLFDLFLLPWFHSW